ncbi:MAG TPA: class I SAM-dependent methyltransferase, partial [Bacillota bacterium]|nr:class I SAM-dependent methyltransferase [Bacillota bacterium]
MPPKKTVSPDDFQTPPQAVAPLLPYLNKDWVIWECAAGKGYVAEYLKSKGYAVISTDIKKGKDFLKYAPEKFDCIITNPPYSLKQEFLQRAFELGKPFAFLLPIT